MEGDEKTPGAKLLRAVLIAAALSIPIFMVWFLVYDRQSQSQQASASITEGWGGPQVMAGPLLVIPYRTATTETAVENGKSVTRTRNLMRELTLVPEQVRVNTNIRPERRKRSIYEAVVYEAQVSGRATIVGDLVVDIVPFMDSACPDGWAKALDEVERAPFETLIPGHGAPMTRADFSQWKLAYTNLVKCGRSSADKATCAAGWKQDAARFIDEAHGVYADEAADYYLTTRLRSSPEEQQRFCKPLKAGS